MEMLHEVSDAVRVWFVVCQRVNQNKLASKDIHAGVETPADKVR